ncbi:hypothetical protein F5887DRAFT_1083846 [Amanita rubescens]|nr:hypothetical protein F5887DRAFT_1083846 [Amanita rubescens]
MATGDSGLSGSPSKLVRHRKACREYYERNKERIRATQRIKARQRRAREREQKYQKALKDQASASSSSEETERCRCCGQLMPSLKGQRREVSEDQPSKAAPLEKSGFDPSPREESCDADSEDPTDV